VVERMGSLPARPYLIAIWLAMLTTAIAGIYTLARRVQGWSRLPFGLVAFTVALIAFPLSLYGFRLLVATLYPLSGYVGAGCLVAVLFSRSKARLSGR